MENLVKAQLDCFNSNASSPAIAQLTNTQFKPQKVLPEKIIFIHPATPDDPLYEKTTTCHPIATQRPCSFL
jgi:hypothetical protein